MPKSQYQKSELCRATAVAEKLQLQDAHDKTISAHSQLQEAYDTLSKEHSMIKSLYTSLVGSLELPNELGEGATTLTPRPEWENVAKMMKCDTRDLGASTEQRVRSLATRVDSSRAILRKVELESTMTPFICTIGTREDVPSYLQYNGIVRNELWSYDRTKSEVKELWKLKESLEEVGDTKTMEEVLLESVKAIQVVERQAEKSYNLYTSVCRYAPLHSDIHMFLEVLQGNLDPAIIPQMISKVVNEVAKSSSDFRDAAGRDIFLEEDIMKAVEFCCPMKPEKSRKKLYYVLKQDLLDIGGLIELTPALLACDIEPSQTELEFTQLLREQTWYERMEYFHDIQRSLQNDIWKPDTKLDSGDLLENLGTNSIQSKDMVESVLLKLDPHIPPVELANMMNVGFENEQVVTLGTLLARWRYSSVLKRFSRSEN